jgi:hypothetical protein
MKIFQIYRKANKNLNETQDVYIGYRMSEKVALDWIESQTNQMYPSSDYYLISTDTKS